MRKALVDLLATHKFPSITAVMIVQRAGVGYATFFRHYDSPEALLMEIANRMHDEFGNAMTTSIFDDSAGRNAVRTWSDYVHDNRDLTYAIFVNAGPFVQRSIEARVTETIRKSLLRWQPGLPMELAVRHAVSATLTVLSWWLETNKDDPEELAALFDRLVIQPIYPRRSAIAPSAGSATPQ